LPENLPLAVACPASCATATVAATLTAARNVEGQNICLFGAGMLGITACAMLSVRGAANIVCVDLDEDRLFRLSQFGATHAVIPQELSELSPGITSGHGFDTVLEFSGSREAVRHGWEVLRLGGTLVLVGSTFPTASLQVYPEQIVRRNLRILGIHNYTPQDLVDAVSFLEHHGRTFPFESLVTEWFALESAAEAFRTAQDSSQIRVGIGMRYGSS
jgi:alcohol dehydrogenase